MLSWILARVRERRRRREAAQKISADMPMAATGAELASSTKAGSETERILERAADNQRDSQRDRHQT